MEEELELTAIQIAEGFGAKPYYFQDEEGERWCRLHGYEFKDLPYRGSNFLDAEIFVSVVKGTRGNLAVLARRLGVHRDTVFKFLRRPENEDLREIVNAERESAVDDLENKLLELALGGREKSLHFALNTLGHKRGYGFTNSRQQIAVSTMDNNQVEVPQTEEEMAKFIANVMSAYEELEAGDKDNDVVEGEYKDVNVQG